VTFTHDGRRILSGGYDHTARLWDIATGKVVQRLEGHTNTVLCVAISANDRFAVTASQDKTLRLWKLRK
jgi:WD40 repeat protein